MTAIIVILACAVIVLGLVLYAHMTAQRDDKNFSAPPKQPESMETPYIFRSGSDMTWQSESRTYTFQRPDRKMKEKPSLQDQLNAALDAEKYEEAARIRDEIKKLKKK